MAGPTPPVRRFATPTLRDVGAIQTHFDQSDTLGIGGTTAPPPATPRFSNQPSFAEEIIATANSIPQQSLGSTRPKPLGRALKASRPTESAKPRPSKPKPTDSGRRYRPGTGTGGATAV